MYIVISEYAFRGTLYVACDTFEIAESYLLEDLKAVKSNGEGKYTTVEQSKKRFWQKEYLAQHRIERAGWIGS